MKIIKDWLERRRQRRRAEQYQKGIEQDYINKIVYQRKLIINKDSDLPFAERRKVIKIYNHLVETSKISTQ